MASPKLPRRKLGNTGLEVSVIGFGASPLGGVFEDIDEDAGVAAVHEAFALGINLFDTSPFYGSTRSETVLGRGLKDLPRDQIVVATKVGRYGQDVFDFSAARVKASVRESLGRLQLSYVDLIQTHDIEFATMNQIVEETLPALEELRREGLVRHIGITGLPLKVFRSVLDRVQPGLVEVILSYCHCCLVDRSLLELLPYLAGKSVGVINASILSMGLLTKQGPPAWHPAPDDVKDAARRAAAAAGEHGVDIAKLAIMEAVQQRGVATTLIGFATPEQVRTNVQYTLEGLGLSPSDSAAAEQTASKEVAAILTPVLGRTWPSGKPENN